MPRIIEFTNKDTGRVLRLREGAVADAFARSPRFVRGDGRVIEGDGAESPPAPAVAPSPPPEPEREAVPHSDALALMVSYAQATNIGEVKALATSAAAAAVLHGLEQAAATPRTSLLSWLADKAGDALNAAPAPEPEATAPEPEPVY